jgi:hypothetical protein
MANAPDLGGAKVEYQTETIDFGADGKATSGMKVGFVTALGNHATIFVPRGLYSLDEVARRVKAQATLVDAVHKLGS